MRDFKYRLKCKSCKIVLLVTGEPLYQLQQLVSFLLSISQRVVGGYPFFFFFYKKKLFQSGWFYFALKVSRLGYSIFSIHFATILTKKKFLSKNTSRKWKCSHFTKCWIEYLTLNNQIIGNGPFICKCIPDYNISVKLITCYIYSHSNILCPLLFFTNRPTTIPDLALMNKLFY